MICETSGGQKPGLLKKPGFCSFTSEIETLYYQQTSQPPYQMLPARTRRLQFGRKGMRSWFLELCLWSDGRKMLEISLSKTNHQLYALCHPDRHGQSALLITALGTGQRPFLRGFYILAQIEKINRTAGISSVSPLCAAAPAPGRMVGAV